MNIQKIFNAVAEEEMNSPLPVIISELEKQGYAVKFEGLEVTAETMEDRLFEDLERAVNTFEIELLKERRTEQKFNLVFTDYHKFNFQSC